MDKEEDNIELRSEEFQEVLGNVPHWIVRWGIMVFMLVTVLLLAGSAIFKYPDTINAAMTLTGTTPPAAIVAKTSGKLDTLYVIDNQYVKSEQYLAIVDNPARTEDVMLLKEYLRTFSFGTIGYLPPREMSLGGLQNFYSLFYTTLFDYSEFIRLNYYPAKKEFIKTRIGQYELQYKDLIRQKNIVCEQLSLTTKQFVRDSVLCTKGVLSTEEFEKSRNQYLQGCLSYEGVCTSLGNISLQIMQMKESLLDIEHQFVEKENASKVQLNTQFTQLVNEMRNWEMNYVIMAPINGRITFTNYWVENQNISAGEEIFNIIPTDSVGLIGKALLPMARSGKVKVGQKVNIRFENFPENEFGMVKGVVKNISLVPVKAEEETYYTVGIILSNGLQTTYKKELLFLPQMKGKADIITEDLSLLERLFMPLRKIWNENIKE